MIRKLSGVLLALWCLLIPWMAFAADESRVKDGLGYLTQSQINALAAKAEEISQKYDTDVFVLIDDQSGFSDNYARDSIEAYGTSTYPNGYVGFMVNMADRSYWVDAFGDPEVDIFDSRVIEKLTDMAYSNLRDGDYYGACMDVLNEIGNQFELAQPMGWLKKPLLYPGKTLALVGGAGVIAAVAAWIMTASKQSHHKDKGVAVNANAYGSNFALTANNSQYIRSYQTRMPRPKVQSSGGGGGFSGGGSAGHSGGGGHF